MWKIVEIFLILNLVFSFVISMPAKVKSPDDFNVENLKILQMMLRNNSLSNSGNNSAFSGIRSNLRKGATMGMLLGAIQAEEKMEKKLLTMFDGLFKNINILTSQEIAHKINLIESQMGRDKRAMQILNNAIGLAMNRQSVEDYRAILRNIAAEDSKMKAEKLKQMPLEINDGTKKDLQINVDKLKMDVTEHLKELRTNMSETARETLKYLKPAKNGKITVTTTESIVETTTMNEQETTHSFLSDTEMMKLQEIVKMPAFLEAMRIKFQGKPLNNRMEIIQLPLMSHNQAVHQNFPPNSNFFPNPSSSSFPSNPSSSSFHQNPSNLNQISNMNPNFNYQNFNLQNQNQQNQQFLNHQNQNHQNFNLQNLNFQNQNHQQLNHQNFNPQNMIQNQNLPFQTNFLPSQNFPSNFNQNSFQQHQNFPNLFKPNLNQIETFDGNFKKSEKLQVENLNGELQGFQNFNLNPQNNEKVQKMKESIESTTKKGEQSENQIDIEVNLASPNSDNESEKEEEFDDMENSNQPGGIVGLIASLSGGEEGSDVGALLGAVSGVISNLFGPDGLDIPSLLSTGTSLIAGLLGGDQNFGAVLGGYVGTAVEGFSGGGADNNGAFFGNLLGTIFAQLSSDPEDDDNPPQPKLFLENFFSSFVESQSKKGTDGDGDTPPGGDSKPGSAGFFGFISNFVSSLVGGITSFVLNASLGSSGGSSQGSADLSAGLSGGSSKGSADLSAGSSDSSNGSSEH